MQKISTQDKKDVQLNNDDALVTFMARISEAKRNAKEIARSIAVITCKDGFHYAVDEFERIHTEHKLTVAESVMFRALIQEEVKSIVLNAKSEEDIQGLSPKEIMECRGYAILTLDTNKEYSWRHGSLTNITHSREVFASESLALEDAISHYDKLKLANPSMTPAERQARNKP